MKPCKKCGKKISDAIKSDLCRHCFLYEYAKKRRKERIKNKCCASCGKKVKPIIKIPYRCKKCQDKIRDYHKKIKEEKNE